MRVISRIALSLARRLPRGYWRVTRFAALRDPALWDLPLPLRLMPGRTIRVDLREPLFTNFLRHGCFQYQFGEDLLCTRLLSAGDIVFDVGANIGYPTILFANLVRPGGRVLACEPSARAFRLLQRTTEQDGNVECRRVAVSDRVGEAAFYETESLATSSLEAVPGVRPYVVPTTTLDIMAANSGTPTFVKVDVEGHEYGVFKGAPILLGSDAPPFLLFEALGADALGSSLAILRDLGKDSYTVFRTRKDGRVGPLGDPLGTNNYLAVPRWGRERISDLVVPAKSL